MEEQARLRRRAGAGEASKAFLENVPVPESVLGGIVVGLGLEHALPAPVWPASPGLKRAGAGLILLGAALIGWSTAAARGMRMAEPSRLLTRGPYGLSRHPMYVGWLAIAAGIGLIARSFWVLVGSLAAFLYLDRVEIPREERVLAASFGDAYVAYRARVRRYL